MKALSVVYPHGTRIARGEKTIEVRSWLPTEGFNEEFVLVENNKYLREPNEVDPAGGKPVAVIRINNVRPFLESDIPAACATRWEPGYYSWEVSVIRQIQTDEVVLATRGLYDIDQQF